ncbi:beta-microseminoprotein-like [Scomber japonicus]|uniref:beta-microseminoprotein-like n=1 Tax=Scomber japonicus TaxID=13676 RepID=UPI002306DB88|nr:beta-microseminoprotein-like [Scomber japonicus]
MHYFQPLTFTLSNLTSLTATMKYLALALLLCSLPSLSDAACYYMNPELGETATHCQDYVDKTWHPVGSTWRNSECRNCGCSLCCDAYSTPRHFPDDCVSVFDWEECVYIVHKKDDPSVQCPIYAAVGK